ncbi:SDR family NAD(P)-dependent oxidoreductase [Paenibacillus marchantiophytorum]|uniref:SDR family NAD(P)-dependent oxidoreductase n=1 Tax=Paenibacillus marchantiophytorum TaxID=1619310 RepID=UPI00166A1F30|nr:SDR family NAD(P)-dependent oxidoreductase [Paenibacillus marchantiophytorum]
MRLSNKRTLITGGARGIGKGIVERFLREGAKVFVLDIKETELSMLKAEIVEYADSFDYAVIDLNDLSAIPAVVEQAISRWNGMDILINNAGMAVRESFLDIPLNRWNQIMNVNLNSMFLISQLVAKQMVEQGGGGSIVNMTSKNGLKGSGQLAHYNTSKGGVVLLTESMAVELAAYGIRVNAVAPGNIGTPLDDELKKKENRALDEVSAKNPMKRMGTIAEIANAFLFLASEEAAFVNGSTVVVDGGHLANASEL